MSSAAIDEQLKKRIEDQMVTVPKFEVEVLMRGVEFSFPEFQISKYLVTQELWEEVMGHWPHFRFSGKNLPAENVSWDDICHQTKEGNTCFLTKLKERTGIQYQLPSESIWEFAARGAYENYDPTKRVFKNDFSFAGGFEAHELAWYQDNSFWKAHAIGMKLPNVLGLYDLSGNLWEWCADAWNGSVGTYMSLPNILPKEGYPYQKDSDRKWNLVVRGGSCDLPNSFCRVAYRGLDHCDSRLISGGGRLVRY